MAYELSPASWEEALSGGEHFLELPGKGWGRQELAKPASCRSSPPLKNLCSSQFPSAHSHLPQAEFSSLVARSATIQKAFLLPESFPVSSILHAGLTLTFCSDQGDQVTALLKTPIHSLGFLGRHEKILCHGHMIS